MFREASAVMFSNGNDLEIQTQRATQYILSNSLLVRKKQKTKKPKTVITNYTHAHYSKKREEGIPSVGNTYVPDYY